jgi:hypothetical protein
MSTVGAAAYINRMDLHQEGDRFLEADNHKFSDRGEEHVIAQGILAPDHAPEYLKNADPKDKQLYRQTTERLWNDAEHAGHKSNAITGREWMLPIPSELDKQEVEHLVRAFVSDYLVEKGMVAQYAIHEPNEKNDERNLHAHVLTTDRDITPEGFAAKKTASLQWHHRDLIREAHSQWAKACNNALELSQHPDVHIDNRRNSVQLADALECGDIDRALELNHVPGFHRGRAIKEIETRGAVSFKVKDREALAEQRWEHETGSLRSQVTQIMTTEREILDTVDQQMKLIEEGAKNERRLEQGTARGTGSPERRRGEPEALTRDEHDRTARLERDKERHREHDEWVKQQALKRARHKDRGPEIGR